MVNVMYTIIQKIWVSKIFVFENELLFSKDALN